MTAIIDKETIRRFDVGGPRYTSYPTAPIWSDAVTDNMYIEKLNLFGQTDKTLSLYVHIPFCQSMCTYCGCSVVIRKQDEKYGDEYLAYLFKEIDLIRRYVGPKKVIKQFHWGGGTPTFLSEAQIERLFNKVQETFEIDFDSEIAIEIDPRTIDKSKVKGLRSLGFNRISMGVQDFDDRVQQAVNRVQSFNLVSEFYRWCRELGFKSVNFDLIYGLPNQTVESFRGTVNQVIGLRPDRIALYSFAYVPWMKKHQNKIDTDTLPSNDTKLDIFLNARDQFFAADYQAIAMDHFALKSDEMALAFNEGTLYRNFMGYTVKPADEYIGLGVTSIGFLENTFFQNCKTLPDYYSSLDQNILPIERGKVLNQDDQIRQWVIRSLMCHFKVDKSRFNDLFQTSFDGYFHQEQDQIKKCVDDGLIEIQNDLIQVAALGKIFIRNVCMIFDFYLKQKGAHTRFSKTV